MHADLLASISPGVVLLEEAGELLEAHIISGTHKDVKHLIMIGDHKQLRPKIENHELSVVSGNGHDLNRSLFERMILGGCDNKSLMVSYTINKSLYWKYRYNLIATNNLMHHHFE